MIQKTSVFVAFKLKCNPQIFQNSFVSFNLQNDTETHVAA